MRRLTLVPLLFVGATTGHGPGTAAGWHVRGSTPRAVAPRAVAPRAVPPCTDEEIERLNSLYREKLQQLEDLENAEPIVDQLARVRGYVDMLNEAAGETKSDIEEFTEENAELLDLLKTEVQTQNQNTRRWARSVHQNEAWEESTFETTREASVAGGLTVTADALGDLESFTGDLSRGLESFEQGMRAETPAEQLEAFQNYFDTVTGFINNDEMKAAFPLLRVFEPWFEYFSKAIEFAAVMTGRIEESAETRERMLRDALAAGTDDFFSAWAIDYSPPRKSPYEILAEERERLEAELDEIAERLEDCGEEPPETGTDRPATGTDLPVDYINARKLCYGETGVDDHTAAADERDLAFARRRVESLADQIRSYRGQVDFALPHSIRTKEVELESARQNREDMVITVEGERVITRDPVTVEAELEALRSTMEIYERRIEELEDELAAAYDDYRAKLAPVQALKDCLRRIMERYAPASMDQLPERYATCTYWNLSERTQTLVREVREAPRPRTGGERPPTGGEEDRRVSDARGGEPDAAGPTGAGGGTAVAMNSVPGEVVPSVEPIAFEFAPRGLEEASSTVTGDDISLNDVDAGSLLNSPITIGFRPDPAVQVMIIKSIDLEVPPSSGRAGPGAADTPAPGAAAGGPSMPPGVAWALAPAFRDDPGLEAIITSLGNSSGEAFNLVMRNGGSRTVQLSGDGLVVEPLQLTDRAKQELEKRLTDLAARSPVTATLTGYCLEFLRAPPTAGQLFRIAGPELQEQFAPVRRLMHAADRVRAADLLNPDSDPTGYLDSITQWAIWSVEQDLDLETFEENFIEHTQKNLVAAGQQWTPDIEELIRRVVPNRWNDIRQVLTEAERLAAEVGAGAASG